MRLLSFRERLRSAAAMVVCSAIAASGAAQETVTGVVFLDANRDGVRQSDEQGIGGVAASNGVEVTLTDASGRYTLPASDDMIIFVNIPRGYQILVDGLMLARGYYIHKPLGSPDEDFIFPGVAPTGPLPDSVDFPLVRHQEPEAFSVIVFGDPQPYSLEQVDFFRRDVIDPLTVPNLTGPAGNIHGAIFGISLGDLVGDQLELFGPLNEAQAMLGVPWYNIYGNHDMNFMAGQSEATKHDPDRYAAETFKRVYGPTDYAFQYGRVHFIALDNVIYQGFSGFRGESSFWPGGRVPSTGNYRGGLREHQLRFVENYLRHVPTDDLVVLCFHIPIEMDGPGVHRTPEHADLFRILSTHPHTFSMSGHTHFQQHWFFGAEHGYDPKAHGHASNQHNAREPGRFAAPVHHHLNAVTASGSWYNGMLDEVGVPHTTMRCGAPNGYTLVHFDGNRYSSEFRAARRPADHTMTFHMPAAIGADGDAEIVVNIFNGAKGDTVRMRIVAGRASGGSISRWIPMEQAPRVDLHYAEMHIREQRLPEDAKRGRGMPMPVVSQHVWAAPAPSGLPLGTHTLEVQHTDLYGVTRTARHTFRVE